MVPLVDVSLLTFMRQTFDPIDTPVGKSTVFWTSADDLIARAERRDANVPGSVKLPIYGVVRSGSIQYLPLAQSPQRGRGIPLRYGTPPQAPTSRQEQKRYWVRSTYQISVIAENMTQLNHFERQMRILGDRALGITVDTLSYSFPVYQGDPTYTTSFTEHRERGVLYSMTMPWEVDSFWMAMSNVPTIITQIYEIYEEVLNGNRLVDTLTIIPDI